MKKKTTKAVIIEWVDSYSEENTWIPLANIAKPRNLICISIGWIEKETKDNITIIPHISDFYAKNNNGCGLGILTIPKVAILRRVKLKYKL